MKNIHVLPTDKPSRLYSYKSNLFLTTESHLNVPSMEYQNIYITSDEEIKEGFDQWYLDKVLNKPYNSGGAQYSSKQDVIVLTTDQDLIKDGVQAIDDEFLDWFVKNPSCEEVEVQKWFDGVDFLEYKIIIPKEEPKKVLTEEDIFNQRDIDAVTDYINKEQQKQHLIDMMESDEELGLYDDIKANRVELICKDCSDSLEDCTCIVSTIDLPRQEDEFCYYSGLPSPTAYSKEEPNMISDWLEQNRNPEIDKQVEKELEYLSKQETLEEAAENYGWKIKRNTFSDAVKANELAESAKQDFIAGVKWQQEQIGKSEFLQRLRGTLSDAEARRLIFEQFKNK